MESDLGDETVSLYENPQQRTIQLTLSRMKNDNKIRSGTHG